jgi:exodeoxyribonuclease VII large subunit
LETGDLLHKRKIYSVSELSADIKRLLEKEFPMVWISGEISNFKVPASGHAYFTLKDKKAQIAAVIFRGQLRQLRFDLKDGMTIIGLGRISVYEPRGSYQIILEYSEPMGVGALQMAFEQLKIKLNDEGLFAAEHKLALPFFPVRIGVITSPTGAAIQDILNISSRRCANLMVDIYPVRVQGAEAAAQIVAAIQLADRLKRDEVLILARGGGSLEDLAAFNDEQVARAIFSCAIPVVSAVGHETDFTISDFVADFRAPTPSAAAEIVVPIKDELRARCLELRLRALRAVNLVLHRLKERVTQEGRRLVHPGKKVQEIQLHLDQLSGRLRRALAARFQQKQDACHKARHALARVSPFQQMSLYKSKVERFSHNILQSFSIVFITKRQRLQAVQAVLQAVNPAAILERGYSITRTLPQKSVVKDAGRLKSDQLLEIQLARGRVQVRVVQK